MEVKSAGNLETCVWPERFRYEKYRVLSSLVGCVVQAVHKRTTMALGSQVEEDLKRFNSKPRVYPHIKSLHFWEICFLADCTCSVRDFCLLQKG